MHCDLVRVIAMMQDSKLNHYKLSYLQSKRNEMFISNTEKKFDKNQHFFIIK